MNIQLLEAAKGRINIGTLIFKAKAVLSLLAAAMQMLFALRDFFNEMKKAKENDGVIDMEEFTAAIGPVVVQFSELESKYNKVMGGDSFKITAADMDAVSFAAGSLPKVPPKVIQPKQERTDTATSEATEETTQQAAEGSAEVAEEVTDTKKQRSQPKAAKENEEI